MRITCPKSNDGHPSIHIDVAASPRPHRWKRVLQAAGIVAPPEGEGAGGPEQGPAQTEGQGTLRKALGMLMLNAGESAAGESLPIAAQAEALVTVLSAFASRRMLIICVEDAEHMPVGCPSFSSHPLSFLYGKH